MLQWMCDQGLSFVCVSVFLSRCLQNIGTQFTVKAPHAIKQSGYFKLLPADGSAQTRTQSYSLEQLRRLS